MPILNSINQMQDQMTEWRQDLHKIPEIGLQEFETSKYIKNISNIYICIWYTTMICYYGILLWWALAPIRLWWALGPFPSYLSDFQAGGFLCNFLK